MRLLNKRINTMTEEKKKRLYGGSYTGRSVELDGYKTDSQVRTDRKYRRLSQGIILLIILIVFFLLVTQDLWSYWISQLRELFINS